MNILIIGSGGREHAIIWALKASPNTNTIYVAPGNAGTALIAENILLDVFDPQALITFCTEKNIGLVFIGPEAPLVEGVVDRLEAANIPVFGPTQKAAILEASKAFTKEFCIKYQIPTAAYQQFTESAPAKAYVHQLGTPIVIKADGLAAGKGVVIAHSEDEACEAIDDMLSGRFGEAGATIVIEEFLHGEEVSVFALVDGNNAVLFGSAQDHKAVGEGDTGPNTGGMGTYSPAPIMTPALEKEIMEKFIVPTVQGMKAEGRPYKGVLFAGMMITPTGPKLLEYNARFGDPETQSLMRRLDSDLPALLLAVAKGNITGHTVKLKNLTAICVVMAAKGYPGDYQKGTVIANLDEANTLPDVTIFHAGTTHDAHGQYVAQGGRVLGVTATGSSIIEAQQKAYNAVDTINWSEGFCRRDIGWRAVRRMKEAG